MKKQDLKLFVAYAHEDRDTVRLLIDSVRKHEWTVYWDEELPAGQYGWQAIVQEELNAAFGVLVVWSAHSVTSAAVIEEARTARANRCLYGVSIDGTEIPAEFADQWSVDLRAWAGDATDLRIEKILEWPDALSKFHTGLDYAIRVSAPLRFDGKSSPGSDL